MRATPHARRSQWDEIKKLVAILMVTQQLTTPLASHAAPLSQTGRWTPTPTLTFSATHTAVLREPGTNATKVFLFGESGTNQRMKLWRFFPSETSVRLPTDNNAFSTLDSLPHPAGTSAASDLFCSGHSTLADGRMMLIGGAWTPISPCREVYTLDPAWRFGVSAAPSPWTAGASMAVQRWYGTATALADGRVLASAGTMSSRLIGFGGLAKGVTMDTTWRLLQPLDLSARYVWGDTFSAPGNSCAGTCPGSTPRIEYLRLNENYTQGQWPPGRESHAFVANYSGDGFVYGGRRRLSNGDYEVLGDAWHLYHFDVKDDTSAGWSLLEQVADPTYGLPGPRYGCAATWAGVENRSDTQLQSSTGYLVCYIHGGRDANGNPLGDLWRGERRVVNGPHYQWWWTRILPDNAATRRFGHTMVFDPGPPGVVGAGKAKLLIFGGWTTTTTLAPGNKLYAVGVGAESLQPGVWREITPALDEYTPAPPADRAWHAMTPKWRDKNDNERVYYMFGGEAGSNEGTATPVAADSWVLTRPDGNYVTDGEAFVWKKYAASGSGPSGRSRPGLVYSHEAQTLVLVGGDTNGSGAAGGLDSTVWAAGAKYAEQSSRRQRGGVWRRGWRLPRGRRPHKW